MNDNQVIPDAAVEAAAREAFFVDDIGGHIRGRWTWETIPEDGRDNYRKLALAVVTAAAAHMPSTTSREQGVTAKQIAHDIRTTPVPGPCSLAEPIADHLYKLGYRKASTP